MNNSIGDLVAARVQAEKDRKADTSKYFYRRCKHCIIAHNIYERTENPDKPTYITEVNGEEMAKFMTGAMNEKES